MGWGGAITSFALRSHTDAALLYVLLQFHGYVVLPEHIFIWIGWGGVLTRMLRYCTLACSSTDASCYLSTSSYEHIFIWIGWGGVGWGNNVICFAFSHGRALLCSCNSMDASCYLSTFSYDMDWVGWGGAKETPKKCTILKLLCCVSVRFLVL